MAGFLVPFAAGGIAKALEIRNEYDETAGNLVDAASEKYNAQFDINQKAIELQNANFAAVEAAFGTVVAEVAAKEGLLQGVDTALIKGRVEDELGKAYIASLKSLKFGKKGDEGPDGTILQEDETLKSKLKLQTVFSEDYETARKNLKTNRDWAANNLNKGAVKHLTDLYLAGDKELPPDTGIEKAQSFLFGDRVTEGTGVGFEQAVAQKIGDEITVQPKAVVRSDLKTSIADEIGYQESVIAGTINDVNKSIANVLGLSAGQGFEITGSGDFIFQKRFDPNANAIRSAAEAIADTHMYTTADGKPDTLAIVEAAHEHVQKTIINPSINNWENVTFGDTDVFNKSRSLITSNLSKSFTKELTDNIPDFDIAKNVDFEVKPITKAKGTRGKGIKDLPEKGKPTGDILVSDEISMYLVNKINTQIDTRANKILYVDYIPNNVYVRSVNQQGQEVIVALKDFISQALGLKQF